MLSANIRRYRSCRFLRVVPSFHVPNGASLKISHFGTPLISTHNDYARKHQDPGDGETFTPSTSGHWGRVSLSSPPRRPAAATGACLGSRTGSGGSGRSGGGEEGGGNGARRGRVKVELPADSCCERFPISGLGAPPVSSR